MKILWISLFGLMGVLLRYFLENWGSAMKTQSFPLTTLSGNLIGCFIAGFVYHLIISKEVVSQQMASAIIIGFCGGLTTFSGLCLQSLNLVNSGEISKAFFYLFSSIFCGLITVMIGVKAGSFVV